MIKDNKQAIFAKKLACSQPMWSMVLSGKRNLKYTRAKIAARVLKTKIDLWMDPETPPEKRKKAWEKYNSGAKS